MKIKWLARKVSGDYLNCICRPSLRFRRLHFRHSAQVEMQIPASAIPNKLLVISEFPRWFRCQFHICRCRLSGTWKLLIMHFRNQRTVSRFRLFKNPCPLIIHNHTKQSFFIRDYLITLYNLVHPCDKANKGGCSQLCNKRKEWHVCSCNAGFLLREDKRTCIKGRQFLARK